MSPGWAGSQPRSRLVSALGIVMSIVMNGKPLKWSAACPAGMLAEALGKRGVPDLTASLAAELGIRAFDRAFGQWADPAGHQTLTELTRQALAELRAATATLG